MLDIHGGLLGPELLLHPRQKVGSAGQDGVVPGLSHRRVFGPQEHRVLSVGGDHLEIPGQGATRGSNGGHRGPGWGSQDERGEKKEWNC